MTKTFYRQIIPLLFPIYPTIELREPFLTFAHLESILSHSNFKVAIHPTQSLLMA